MSDVPHRLHPLGRSRPALAVDDLPTPEKVFGVRKLGVPEILGRALGPSVIALGIALGSGEWLLGPQAVGKHGFIGVGWIILVSIVLQTFYNIECSRYVVATGEVPVVGWGRVPPGFLLWVPLSVMIVFLALITGGWAASAGQGLYAFIHGVAPPQGAQEPRLLAIALLAVVLLIIAIAHRISRVLEVANWLMVGTILFGLLLLDAFVVTSTTWWEGIRSFVVPAHPPSGMTATQLGALVGFSALTSGINWYVMGHYRDKGYGMGYHTGFLTGLRGKRQGLRSVGVTFPDDPTNAALWRRWYRLLLIDQWGVFFVGAVLGMLLPTILMAEAVALSDAPLTDHTLTTYVATAFGDTYGSAFFYTALFVGVLLLFSTQLGNFEALVRIATDAGHATSSRLRSIIQGDPRRIYYPFMLLLFVAIGTIVQFGVPVALVQWSANMSNLGALIFPFMLMYLNSRLPRPARPRPWHYVILLANVVFFGFFFVNFVTNFFFGEPLMRF